MSDEARGHHEPLYYLIEDHDRQYLTTKTEDAVQSEGWLARAVPAFKTGNHRDNQPTPDYDVNGLWDLLYSPGFNQWIQADNHDNWRCLDQFNGDLSAMQQYICTMQLLGGPFSLFMGTDVGADQWTKHTFQQGGGIEEIEQYLSGIPPRREDEPEGVDRHLGPAEDDCPRAPDEAARADVLYAAR